MPRLAWLFPLVSLLAACPRIDTGADGGDMIVVGPEGGIFQRNGAVLDIPRGAVTAETRIFVTIVDTGVPDVPQRKRISFGYRLSPTSLKFQSPIKLFLPVIDDRVPRAVDPGTFDSRRNVGNEAYTQLPGAKTTRLEEQGLTVVEAQTDKLGLFWLTSPSEPNVSRLELTPAEATLQVGGTQQFTAQVVDPTGQTIDATVSWSVAPPRVASVDSKGLLTALDPGTATVTARAGTQSATATVFVLGAASGPSTFVHDNPFPTGNDLWAGALAPGGLGVVFAGANGTVLARSGTNQWTRLFSSPGLVLKGVGGTTADDAVAVGVTGTTGVLVELKGAATAPTVRVLNSVEPRALWYDGTHGMAVGTGNDVLIRRAGRWETEYSPSFETLLAVAGDGAGSFVTVGSRGSIYKWDPVRKVWDSLYQTQLAVLLTAAAFATPTGLEAWAVGGDKLWHFASGGWTAENLPTSPAFMEANALGLLDGHLVVTGRSTTREGLILTWRLGGAPDGGGSPWASYTLRGPQVGRGVFGGGAASTVGFVVGDFGAVWAWNGAGFTEVSKGFYGDVADLAVVPGDVLAAVNECAGPTCTARLGTVMHQADGGWEALGGAQPFSDRVWALAARSSSDVVVTTSTTVYRWDGATWAPVAIQGGLAGAVFDLKWCGATLWGAGENGTVYRGTATLFANAGSPSTEDLWALHCPTDQEVWVAGDGFLASRIGGGLWTPRDSDDVQHGPWRAVWGPGGGEAFAFGDARYGVYWDTSRLNALETLGGILPDVVTGLWGSSIDNLYAVGLANFPARFGFALRFDGVQWRLVDSGSQRKVTAIDGRGATDVWVGTEGGGLLRAVPPP